MLPLLSLANFSFYMLSVGLLSLLSIFILSDYRDFFLRATFQHEPEQ